MSLERMTEIFAPTANCVMSSSGAVSKKSSTKQTQEHVLCNPGEKEWRLVFSQVNLKNKSKIMNTGWVMMGFPERMDFIIFIILRYSHLTKPSCLKGHAS